MNDRLTDLLERVAPEPPRPVELGDIARRVHRQARIWQPLIAAACIAIIATVAIIVASRPTHRDAAAPGHPTSSRPSAASRTASPGPTRPTASKAPADLPIKPWGARILRAIPTLICPCDLSSDGNSLYTTDQIGTTNSLRRLDPDSGSVLASFRVHDSSIVAGPVFTDGLVWLALDARGIVTVRGLDPETLATRASLPSQRAGAGRIGLAASDSQVFLAVRDRVIDFDTHDDTIVHEYRPPTNPVVAVAARAGRLYVGTRYGVIGGALYSYDIATRQLVRSSTDLAAIVGIAPSTGGLWMTESTGNSTTISLQGRVVQYGGGGFEPTVGIFGSTAWLGGTTLIRCADATSGKVHASTQTQAGKVRELVTDVVVASGRVFAAADDGAYRYFVELHPPAACR